MPSARLPVFWVCGAVGAGKSVTAWALWRALADSGITVAYVDIDQLGMLYPADDTDPQRHLLKAQALVSLVPGYRAAGAQVLVVSGVINPDVGLDPDSAAALDLTLCLLTPAPDALRVRILARGSDEDEVEEAIAENTALRRAPFIHAVVETAGLTVSQAAARLRQHVTVAEPSPSTAVRGTSSAGTAVVLLTGARAVGLSTLGYGLAMTRWRAGQRTGFIDLQQLAFHAGRGASDSTRSALMLTQFAAIHEHLTARGANMVVANGHLSSDDLNASTECFPRAPLIVIRVRADFPTLQAHVRERVAGNGARLAGDDLAGASPAHRQAVVADALADQCNGTHADGEIVIDVTGRSSVEVIEELEQRIVEAS